MYHQGTSNDQMSHFNFKVLKYGWGKKNMDGSKWLYDLTSCVEKSGSYG